MTNLQAIQLTKTLLEKRLNSPLSSEFPDYVGQLQTALSALDALEREEEFQVVYQKNAV